jgi:hypothetical protein
VIHALSLNRRPIQGNSSGNIPIHSIGSTTNKEAACKPIAVLRRISVSNGPVEVIVGRSVIANPAITSIGDNKVSIDEGAVEEI